MHVADPSTGIARPELGRGSAALVLVVGAALALVSLSACGSGGGGGGSASPVVLPPESRLGERLFRETRFAQHFAARVAGRSLGDPLPGGDPVVDEVETSGSPLPGPYAGRSISCAACHLSDEVDAAPGGGARGYCDFARHSRIPDRGDGRAATPRNTPAIRDAALPRAVTAFFHYDGEFGSLEELCSATLCGRNTGWLPDERSEAVAHVARIVREDDGSDANAIDHGGGSYATVFAGTTGMAPDGAFLPVDLRADVGTASDEELLDAVSRLLARYVRDLSLGADPIGARAFRSPYDRFVEKNGLPARPGAGEGDLAYARRLRTALVGLTQPQLVDARDGELRTHDHAFVFGTLELRGLRVFLAEPGGPPPPPPATPAIGSCVSCHAPPSFTDFSFHNVGTSQVEYDAEHGLGAFSSLPVPGLLARNADPERFLPPSPAHPDAIGRLRSAPSAGDPSLADLGIWNVFANPALPAPQASLRAAILARLGLPTSTTDDALLPLTLGWMKTPTLRNLGHSAPYFHGGHADTLTDAVQHYRASSLSARFGLVRNAAPQLAGIAFDPADLQALEAFLASLDEDPP